MSGARTLDELMLGRILLFDKIYRHQKVRAAEAMVSAILGILAELAPNDVLELPYLFTDEQLIGLTVDHIEKFVGCALEGEQRELAELAAFLARRLRERNLFVRCFAYAHRMPLDSWIQADEQREGLRKLSESGDNPEDLSVLEEMLAEQARAVIEALDISVPPLLLANLERIIRFDPPEAGSKARDIYNAHLITPEGEVVLFKEDTAEARGWSDAYPLARDLGMSSRHKSLVPLCTLRRNRLPVSNSELGCPSPCLLSQRDLRRRSKI
jgi:hypothetical protein